MRDVQCIRYGYYILFEFSSIWTVLKLIIKITNIIMITLYGLVVDFLYMRVYNVFERVLFFNLKQNIKHLQYAMLLIKNCNALK